MTTPKQSDQYDKQPDKYDPDRTPTREELETDVSIPATFDEVMQAVTDGYGTRRSGPDSTILERKGKR